MCKITFNELAHSDFDRPTVSFFEAWFSSTFGMRSVHVREVLCAYINVIDPQSCVIDYLLGLQERRSVVFDPSMDQGSVLRVDGMLFVPSGTTVKSRVQAKGIYCNGDVLFQQSVVNELHDIRIAGMMVAGSLECRKSGCIAGSLDIKLGHVVCEGDLIVRLHLIVAGTLTTLGHLKASSVQVKKAARLEGGLEISESVHIDESYQHRGSLEVSQSFAVGSFTA